MANIDIYKQKLVAIANAIREKLSEVDTYKLEEMPTKILSIETGGSGIDIADEYTNKAEIAKDFSITSFLAFNSIDIANGYSIVSVSKG